MTGKSAASETGFRRRLLLPVLMFGVFATVVIDVSAPLLLTDIAKTFQVSVGTASFIRSSSAIAGVIFGLILAVLSVRYNHRSLILLGLLSNVLAAIVGFLAPTISLMNAALFFDGIASVIVAAMAYSLIGEVYPLEKRGKAIGWIVAAGFLGFTVGAPITGLIADAAGWRYVMLWFVLPVSIASLVLGFLVFPSNSKIDKCNTSTPIFEGYKKTLSNRSAVACLIGTMLAFATGTITVYVVSFWKTQFLISTSMGSLMTLVNATLAAAGGIAAGRLVSRFGRKRLGVTGGFIESILVVLTVLMPTLLLSWGVSMIRVFCYGTVKTSFSSLTLEQVQEYRGSMMALSGAFGGMGSFLGTTIGGIILNGSNYQSVALFLGTLGVASIGVVLFLARDPTIKFDKKIQL